MRLGLEKRGHRMAPDSEDDRVPLAPVGASRVTPAAAEGLARNPVQVSLPVLIRLKELQQQYQQDAGRRVTLAETVERLLDDRTELVGMVQQYYQRKAAEQ